MQPSFEIFDHTADAGLRLLAPTLDGLLEPAANGLYALIGDLVPSEEARRFDLELAGTDAANLLRDYLGELLFLFETQRRMIGSLDARSFDDHELSLRAQSLAIDTRSSLFHREVKAITYHELDIREIPGGVEATIIVDI